MDNDKSFFASRSLGLHLFRGLIGGLALWGAIAFYHPYPWAGLLALAVMVVAFRGCPLCWSVGLFETSCGISKRRKTKPDSAA